MGFDSSSYDFNTGLYGSDGSSVATPSVTGPVAKSDSSMLDSFLKIVGVGATAYENITGAQAAKKASAAAVGPSKTAAPVIGTPTVAAGGLTANTKAILIGAGVLVLALFGFLLMRRR